METIKVFFFSFLRGAAVPYRLMFDLFGGSTRKNLFLWVYIALAIVSYVLFIITFPWLALATFVVGCAAPFVLFD